MYCPKCGWQNPDAAQKCANCFADLRPVQAPAQPQHANPTQQMPSQPQYPQQPYPQQPYPQPQYPQQPYPQQPYQHPQQQQNYQAAQTIPDHLIWSILAAVFSFLFCCVGILSLPFAIIAIVKSAQCSSKKAQGDYYGALSDSNAAKTWLFVALCLFVVMFLFVIASGLYSRFLPSDL